MPGNKYRKLFNPSADRNKEPILNELKHVLSKSDEKLLLEISSGTGQHVYHIAPNFPNIKIQPSELTSDSFGSISAYSEDCPTRNICYPIKIDISKPLTSWPRSPSFCPGSWQGKIDYVLNINMIHITPIDCVKGLFDNSTKLLKINGLLLTYGPYGEHGVISPQSNVDFDKHLKQSNPEYGVRDLTQLKKMAQEYGIIFRKSVNMPANNKFIVWEKVQ